MKTINLRSPYFDGTNYTYSKVRMKIYLQLIDYHLWLNVSKDPYNPIKIANNIEELKLENEFNEHDIKKKCFFDVSAINCLYCALSNDEFNRVSMCCSAYEIWKTLEVTHEGINQVKETKINMIIKWMQMNL